jgi:hypothetical protein
MKKITLFIILGYCLLNPLSLFAQEDNIHCARCIPKEFKTKADYEHSIVDNAGFIFEGVFIGQDTTIYAPDMVKKECKDHSKLDWYEDVISYHRIRVGKIFRGDLKEGEIVEVLFLGGSIDNMNPPHPNFEMWDNARRVKDGPNEIPLNFDIVGDKVIFFSKSTAFQPKFDKNAKVLILQNTDYHSSVGISKTFWKNNGSDIEVIGLTNDLYKTEIDYFKHLSTFKNITLPVEYKTSILKKNATGGSFGDVNSIDSIVMRSANPDASILSYPDLLVAADNKRYETDAIGNWLVFDITARAVYNETWMSYLNSLDVAFTFNTQLFGTSLFTNNKIQVTVGEDILGTANASTYEIGNKTDLSSGTKVAFTLYRSLVSPPNRILMNDLKRVMKVRILIQNCGQASNINFSALTGSSAATFTQTPIITGSSFAYLNTIYYNPSFRTALTPTDICALADSIKVLFSIQPQGHPIGSQALQNDIRAGVGDTLIITLPPSINPNLAANHYGFGTTKGRVYFIDASHPAPPNPNAFPQPDPRTQYIRIDPEDILYWANNRIVVLLTSTINSPVKPATVEQEHAYIDAVPGSGQFKVRNADSYTRYSNMRLKVLFSTINISRNGIKNMFYLAKQRGDSSGCVQHLKFKYHKSMRGLSNINGVDLCTKVRDNIQVAINNWQQKGVSLGYPNFTWTLDTSAYMVGTGKTKGATTFLDGICLIRVCL